MVFVDLREFREIILFVNSRIFIENVSINYFYYLVFKFCKIIYNYIVLINDWNFLFFSF